MPDTPAFRWTRRIGLAVLTVNVGVPLFVIVRTSITPLAQLHADFSWWPHGATLTSYLDVWTTIPFSRYLANSLIVATSSTLLALVVAIPAGYAVARSRGRGARAFGALLLATQAAPGLLFALPLFLLYVTIDRNTGLHLVGSYIGLVITDLTFALPLCVWLVASYLAAIPTDVEDAARVDGAGTRALLLRVVIPIGVPGIVAAGIFAFLVAWGEVLFATILTDERTQTLPVGLHGFATQSTVYTNQLTAAALIGAMPALAGFLLAQRVLSRVASPASRQFLD